MALIHCLECKTIISDSALRCPKCAYQLRKLKRGFMGLLFKWSFIIFNVFMFPLTVFEYYLSVLHFSNIQEVIHNSSASLDQAAETIGFLLAPFVTLWFWVSGDIILGLLVFFTKPKE